MKTKTSRRRRLETELEILMQDGEDLANRIEDVIEKGGFSTGTTMYALTAVLVEIMISSGDVGHSLQVFQTGLHLMIRTEMDEEEEE